MAFGATPRQDKLLTNVSVKYQNDDYIAESVFPRVEVAKETDKYLVFNSEFRIPYTVRADRTAANEYSHAYSTASYNLTRHALKDIVTDRQRDNMSPAVRLDIDTTENLTDKIQLRREWETFKVAFTTTSWSNNSTLASTTSWRYNTTTSSDPFINGSSVLSAVVEASAKKPNKVLLGHKTLMLLRDNVNILERIKYSERGIVTKDILASGWDVDEVLVGAAIYDQGDEGLTESLTSIWSNHALWYFKPARPGMMVPSSGYTFAKGSRTAKRWRDDALEGNWIEINDTYMVRAVATATAHLYIGTDI